MSEASRRVCCGPHQRVLVGPCRLGLLIFLLTFPTILCLILSCVCGNPCECASKCVKSVVWTRFSFVCCKKSGDGNNGTLPESPLHPLDGLLLLSPFLMNAFDPLYFFLLGAWCCHGRRTGHLDTPPCRQHHADCLPHQRRPTVILRHWYIATPPRRH